MRLETQIAAQAVLRNTSGWTACTELALPPRAAGRQRLDETPSDAAKASRPGDTRPRRRRFRSWSAKTAVTRCSSTANRS